MLLDRVESQSLQTSLGRRLPARSACSILVDARTPAVGRHKHPAAVGPAFEDVGTPPMVWSGARTGKPAHPGKLR